MTTVATELTHKAEAARKTTRILRSLPTYSKNQALLGIANALDANQEMLSAANAKDMARGRDKQLEASLLARLELGAKKLAGMAEGIRKVAALPDPVGEIFDARTMGNGLRVERRRVPLGLIGSVFEARPEVPTDISALCIKSGNAVVLRGGSEATNTNIALGRLIQDALAKTDVPPAAVQMVESVDRALVEQMIKMDTHFDLIIPRGGASLVRFIVREATVPAITGGIGVCHAYVDAQAEATMAANIVLNAKVQAPAVCNALDTLLVHAASAPEVLVHVAQRLLPAGVELRCDERALTLLRPVGGSQVHPAGMDDFGQEFLGLVLSVRIVDSIDEAIDHIETFGSGHSEVIITDDTAAATRFVDQVDAAVVLVNASTRFNDGGQLGLGAEVAISTSKLHARGPMGLHELTSYKWVAIGSGQVRE